MKNNIYYTIRCLSICITAMFGLAMFAPIAFAVIAYKLISMVFSYLHKGICKILNIIGKYKKINTKADISKNSFEISLHQ